MAPESLGETFEDRWARWQTKAAAQDRVWRRTAIASAIAIGAGVIAWLAVALAGA